ncbi:MAG TPA: type VI secretion system tube protein Hcp [Rhodopila sp.]|jgi:type VI protein secretion system component Hcp|nr:type VI secretion system tube protein Hcp [Rhodopila sp.]
MDSDSGDLLLKMVLNGTAITGASQSVLTVSGKSPSPLVKGFTAGSIIEIDNFTLRLGTSGLEAGTKPPPPMHTSGWPTSEQDEQEKRESIGALARKGGYQSWRSGKLDVQYPLDIQPITFEKPADVSSKALIDSCIACASYDSATIIKRKPMGTDSVGEAYLRLDFSGVLVIKVDWSDEDDYIKETVSFIARGITMSYRPQTSSGNLGPVISGFWSMVPDEKQMTFS